MLGKQTEAAAQVEAVLLPRVPRPEQFREKPEEKKEKKTHYTRHWQVPPLLTRLLPSEEERSERRWVVYKSEIG